MIVELEWGYEVKCKDCDRKYRGTTERTAYHRTGQHVEDWAGRKSCAMWEHSREYHNGGGCLNMK